MNTLHQKGYWKTLRSSNNMEVGRRTICFDFDGVIHSYESGWRLGHPEHYIPDGPVEGAKEAIDKLREAGFRVVVFSTRCRTEQGRQAISRWLLHHGFTVDEVCAAKPPALLYVDDHGFRFTGSNWDELQEAVQTYEHWMPSSRL